MNRRLHPILLLSLVAALCLCSAAVSGASVLERLQGRWVSDREGSMAATRELGRLSPEKIDKLAPVIWGNVRVSFDGDRVVRHLDGKVQESRLRVLSEEGNVAVFEFLRENDDQPFILPEHKYYRVEVYDDHHWVTFEEPPKVRDRFARVKDEGEASADRADSDEVGDGTGQTVAAQP